MWVKLEPDDVVVPLRTLRSTSILCAFVLLANVINVGVTVYSAHNQTSLGKRVTSIEVRQSQPTQQTPPQQLR